MSSTSEILPRHGATVEEMTQEVNKAKQDLEKAQKELKSMTGLQKAR